ncbi:MAG: family 1 glycosylhydrolase [Acidimicrobiales bacterium]
MAPDAGDEPATPWLGVATAGYAVEGGCNWPHEPANDWVQWERSGLVPPSGKAADFWRHPEPLLDRAAAIGCDAFGLSVEWSRIEPDDGRVDAAALDRYGQILAACAERGLTPVVTLHHQVHPWWLGEEYWLTPGSPDRFACHVARVVEHLGARCRQWVTLHEPNLRAAAGWVVAAEPPARVGALADAWAVWDNLLTAHVLAYEALHRAQPDAQVTVAPRASSVYDCHQLLVDLLCARHWGVPREGLDRWLAGRRAAHDRAVPPAGPAETALRFAVAVTSPFGAGPDLLRRATGRVLRRPSPHRGVEAVFTGAHRLPLDAVAVSWQQPVPGRLFRVPTAGGVGRGPAAPWLRRPWEVPPDPTGLAAWCHRQAEATPGLPLWVVDDGLATDPAGRPRVDGWDRARYLDEHVQAVLPGGPGARVGADAGSHAEVARAGVAGYLYRSISDGYEPDGARRGLDDAGAAAFGALAAERTAERIL